MSKTFLDLDQIVEFLDEARKFVSDRDIAHYQKVVVALNETIRIMAEIDEVIEAHGGWPDAFHALGSAERHLALLKVAESSPPCGPALR